MLKLIYLLILVRIFDILCFLVFVIVCYYSMVILMDCEVVYNVVKSVYFCGLVGVDLFYGFVGI